MTESSNRKHPRFPSNVAGQIRNMGESNWSECQLQNLSLGGTCVVAQKTFADGCLLEIAIPQSDPKKDSHRFMCRVVWHVHNTYGLQFITRV